MSTRPSTPVRYGPTLVLGLVGAVAVSVGVTRPWATATAHQTGMPVIEASVSGADLVPLAGALGVVVLAAFGAVIATRGWVRRGLGVLIVSAAAVIAGSAIHPTGATAALRDGLSAKGWSSGSYDTGTSAWRWVVLAGALLCLAAGAAISRYGARWATMGREYDAPAATGTPSEPVRESHQDDALTEADVWREIDQGRDPTRRETP